MQVFALFDVSDPTQVKQCLEDRYESDYRAVEPNIFFVAARDMTTRELWEDICPDASNPIRGVILPVTSVYGFHDRELWEWIGVKMRANGD